METNNQVQAFGLAQLTDAEIYQYSKDNLQRVKSNADIQETMAPQQTAWDTTHKAYADAYLSQSQKSLKTDDIKAADTDRDYSYQSYERFVIAQLRNPDPEAAAAAKRLNQLNKDYNINVREDMIREGSKIENLCEDLMSGEKDYAKDLQKIAATRYVSDLFQKNLLCNQLLHERTDESAEYVKGLVRQMRAPLEQAISQYIAVLNAQALIAGLTSAEAAAKYQPTIDLLNAEIDHYRQLLRTRRGRAAAAAARKEEEDKQKPDDAPSGSDTQPGDQGGSDQQPDA